MRESYKVDTDAVCPFYHRHKSCAIACEGIYKGTTIVTQFETGADRSIHIDKFCRDKYRSCKLYRAISLMVYDA